MQGFDAHGGGLPAQLCGGRGLQQQEDGLGGAEDERRYDTEGRERGVKTACYAADACEVVVDEGGGVIVEGFTKAGS